MTNKLVTPNKEYVAFSLVGYQKRLPNETLTSDESRFLSSVACIWNDNGFNDFKQNLWESDESSKDTNLEVTSHCPLTPINSPILVIALDVGTTCSGYSFVFRNDKSNIQYMRKGKDMENHHKIPTILLLTPDKNFHSFGNEARNYFYNMNPKESVKWYYFEYFKMNLYSEKFEDKKVKMKSTNSDKEISALTIFIHALKYLCSQAMEEISEQLGFKLTKDDIFWVLSVPAIWTESNKQFMRYAAEKTMLVDKDMLRIALEPECASLYCRNLYHDRTFKLNDDKDTTKIRKLCNIEEGTSYLIVDFGGGTVDITAHEIQNDGFLSEIHKSTGAPHGSMEINNQFERILEAIFGVLKWKQFKSKRSSSYLDLMRNFELRKLEARPERKTPYNLPLSYSFISFFTSKDDLLEQLFKNSKKPKGISYCPKLGIIRLEPSLMMNMFNSVIVPTVKQIKSIFNENPKKTIHYVFLVGGFAESEILKLAMKSALEPETMVITPRTPHLAVLNGSCLYGLNPKLIKSRRAKLTYGIAVLTKFNPSIHPKDKKIKKNQQEWCCDVLDRIVIVNQPVGLFESIKRRYTPFLTNQRLCIFNIYSSPKANVNFITDPEVHKCASLYLELEKIDNSTIINPAIEEFTIHEIELEMFFGQTEIQIIVRDLQTGHLVKSNIAFVNKIE